MRITVEDCGGRGAEVAAALEALLGPDAEVRVERLAYDPEVSDDSPVVAGTFVTADEVNRLLADGWGVDGVLKTHPELSEADVEACVAHAARCGVPRLERARDECPCGLAAVHAGNPVQMNVYDPAYCDGCWERYDEDVTGEDGEPADAFQVALYLRGLGFTRESAEAFASSRAVLQGRSLGEAAAAGRGEWVRRLLDALVRCIEP